MSRAPGDEFPGFPSAAAGIEERLARVGHLLPLTEADEQIVGQLPAAGREQQPRLRRSSRLSDLDPPAVADTFDAAEQRPTGPSGAARARPVAPQVHHAFQTGLPMRRESKRLPLARPVGAMTT